MSLKKNPIHGRQTRKFYEKKWLTELFASGPPVVTGAVAAVKAHELTPTNNVWIWLAVGLGWLLVAQVVKVFLAYKQDGKEDEQRSHEGLQAALSVLHAVITDVLNRQGGEPPDLRATFHRVVPPLSEAEKLEQIIPYVGGACDGENRQFPIHAGITGFAVRQNQVLIMDRLGVSEDAYRKELIAEWAYTAGDARKMTMDRLSAIALPVTDKTGTQVLGVIYIDAKRKNCFSSTEVQNLIVAASGGITKYVGDRYE